MRCSTGMVAGGAFRGWNAMAAAAFRNGRMGVIRPNVGVCVRDFDPRVAAWMYDLARRRRRFEAERVGIIAHGERPSIRQYMLDNP